MTDTITDLNTIESRLKNSLIQLKKLVGKDTGNENLFENAIELIFWPQDDSATSLNKSSQTQDIALIQLHFIRDLFTIYNNHREESEKIFEDLCRVIAESKIPQLLQFLQSPLTTVAYNASRTIPLALCCVPSLILRDPVGLVASLLGMMDVNSTHAMYVFRGSFLKAQPGFDLLELKKKDRCLIANWIDKSFEKYAEIAHFEESHNLSFVAFSEFVLELLTKEKELCADQGAKVIRDTLQNQVSLINKIFSQSEMLEVHCRLLDLLLSLVPDVKDLEKLLQLSDVLMDYMSSQRVPDTAYQGLKSMPLIAQRLALSVLLKCFISFVSNYTEMKKRPENSEEISIIDQQLNDFLGKSEAMLQHFNLIENLFNLAQNEDDVLIEMLHDCLVIYLYIESDKTLNKKPFLVSLLDKFEPFSLFARFLQIVSFDHLVLLDFLISDETNFLSYLLQFLKFCLSHQEYFVKGATGGGAAELKTAFATVLQLKDAIQKMNKRNLFPYNIKPLLSKINYLEQILRK